MRLLESHRLDQQRGYDKRQRVDDEYRIPAETLRQSTRRDPIPARATRSTSTDDKRVRHQRLFAACDVMFGITALRPGSKNAQKIVSRKSRTYKSHAVSRDCANSMQNVMTARAQSAKIITLRRLRRSFSTPAAGAMNVCGSTCSMNANATACADFVTSRMRLKIATEYSQSPISLMSCANHSSRTFRFVRTSRLYSRDAHRARTACTGPFAI